MVWSFVIKHSNWLRVELNELIRLFYTSTAGKEKLGFAKEEAVKLLTGEDGTEVKEDIFTEFPSSSTIFIIKSVEDPLHPNLSGDDSTENKATPKGVVLNNIVLSLNTIQ